MTNNNGYIGVGDEYKTINKRFVGVGGEWKNQSFKFVGQNGYWRLIYTGNPIDLGAEFYVRYLEGYTLEKENSLTIFGGNLKDFQLISPKIGGYYELEKNAQDLFENFSNGSFSGSPEVGRLLGGKKCMATQTSSDYFQFPNDLDARGLVGIDGMKDYNISNWFYISTLPTGTDVIPILSFGDRTNGMEIIVSSDRRLKQIIWVSDKDYTIQTPINKINIGWNSFVIAKVSGTTGIYLSGSATPEVTSTQSMVSPNINVPIKVGTSFKYTDTGLVNYSVPGTGYKYCYLSNTILSSLNIKKLTDRQNPVVVLKDKNSLVETVIEEEWILTIANEKVIVTIPNTVLIGEYDIFIRYYDEVESFHFPTKVRDPLVQLTGFYDDFQDFTTLKENYYYLNRAWGGANGGVVPENVFIRNGELIIRGNGDNYTGNIQGRDRIGNLKFHDNPDDPQFGTPWKTRVGGCAVFNKRTGFGSYEVDCLIPDKLGCAYAIWTFFYNEIYPSDPRYQDFLNDGLHQQGNAEDGYYLTRNHEIDIEFPSHLDGGILSQPSLSNFKANTWRGELQNWDVPTSDPTYWEEYRSNLTPVGFSIADGNYHKIRYDWYPDRVEFFIDDVLKQTNVNTPAGDTIPDISGYFTFGIWFPSSPLPDKPWLANPSKCWGGGVIDPIDGGMKADFDTVEMKVKSFRFTPFTEYISQQSNVGETYPFGGYNKK